MNSKYIKEDKLLVLELLEEIDHHGVEKIRRKADDEITKYMPRKVVLDFNNVSFMDSAGIGMVLGRYKIVNMLGGTLEMENVSTPLRKIFDMSGITRICPIRN
ncbi:MAG: anti-sigma factor antagonist [Clostridia bacterium]|nr:anti-sigma factor antagonist [Clostridia bacterium]